MKAVRRHINRFSLMIVAIFAVQGVAIGFCATPASAATMETAMHAMHGDDHAMSMPCMTDEMPASQTSSCEHCDLFDGVGVFTAAPLSVGEAPLVAVLAPNLPPANQTVSVQLADHFSNLHGPPRSSSLIYSISQRILR